MSENIFGERKPGNLADIQLVKNGLTASDYRVFFNGAEISTWVSRVKVDLDAEAGIPIVWLAFPANPTIRDARGDEKDE